MKRWPLLLAFAAALGALGVVAVLRGSDAANDLFLASAFAVVAAVLVAPQPGGAS